MKENLAPTQLDLFKMTVFDNFIDMDVKFNSPLFHYILLGEVKDNTRDIVTFDLNGIIVTFRKNDFLLVIGLWLTPSNPK